MQKDFRNWHKLKTKLQEQERTEGFFFNVGDVWICSLGLNIGDEEDGKNERYERPILIIRKFNNNLFLALPITSSMKINPYYSQFEYKGVMSSVILSQIRLLDKKRLLRKVSVISDNDLQKIMKELKKIIFD